MKLEVTEKEAKGIFTQRHMKEKLKKLIVVGVITFAIVIGFGLWLPEDFSPWISVPIMMVVVAPWFIFYCKVMSRADKLAAKDLEAMKGE